jgi:hypothetical protein
MVLGVDADVVMLPIRSVKMLLDIPNELEVRQRNKKRFRDLFISISKNHPSTFLSRQKVSLSVIHGCRKNTQSTEAISIIAAKPPESIDHVRCFQDDVFFWVFFIRSYSGRSMMP